MLYLVIVIQLFLCYSSISEDHTAYVLKLAEQLQGEANKLIAEGHVAENLFAPTKPKNSCSSSLFKTPGKSVNDKYTGKRLLVFVSFSMSGSSLKSLAEEANTHNAVLIMRGLHEDSFVKTAAKLKELEVSVDIHPELFETHKITSVPTFIEVKDKEEINRLSGNVSLKFCVSKFEELP